MTEVNPYISSSQSNNNGFFFTTRRRDTRNPLKTLAKFRCVCKPWSNLISDSSFILKRLSQFAIPAEQNYLLLSKMECFGEEVQTEYLVNNENVIKTSQGLGVFHHTRIYCFEGDLFKLGFKIQNPLGIAFIHSARVVGSCNGIVCLVRGSVVCLWNPCTTEYEIKNFDKDLGFEYAVCGFGYDDYNDDYKLVKFCGSGDYKSKVEVYSLKHGLRSTFCDIPYRFYQVGTFFNRALHWVANKGSEIVVVSFDVEKNTFREVPKPASVNTHAYITVGVLGGKLCLLSEYCFSDIELWVMEEYGVSSSWQKLSTIKNTLVKYAKFSAYTSYDEKYLQPLCFSRGGELVMKDGDDLLFYDPSTNTDRSLKFDDISDKPGRFSICSYLPSLATLNSGTYSNNIPRTEGEEVAYLSFNDSVMKMRISRDVLSHHY